MFSLRPYQQDALDAIQASESKRQLVSLPTGTGKTILFVALARKTAGRSLILAHRDELISQAIEKLEMNWEDVDAGVVKAERNELNHQVVVASVQTLSRKNRLDSFPTDFDLLITDEAHHAEADSYKRIYEHFGCIDSTPKNQTEENQLSIFHAPTNGNVPLHLGVTATPNRGDKKGLISVYDEIVYERNIMDFIPEYLSDLRIVSIDTQVNVDGVRRLGSDLNPGMLSDVLNTSEVNGLIHKTWQEHASDRQTTLVFASSIEHAEALADKFSAEIVHHKIPLQERREILSRFLSGEIPVLVNVGILTEGYDNERIDCIVMARPTASEGLYMQMLGRGTRRFPGKEDCFILDVACNSMKHRLISPADLFGIDKETLDGETTVTEAVRKEKRKRDVDLIDVTENELLNTRKQLDSFAPDALAWVPNKWGGWSLSLGGAGKLRIMESKRKKGAYSVLLIRSKDDSKWLTQKSVPAGFALSIGESIARESSLALVDRSAPWRNQAASEKQLAILAKNGIPFEPGITKGHASDLLSMFFEGGMS